jgi:Ca2+:H+ antiporter
MPINKFIRAVCTFHNIKTAISSVIIILAIALYIADIVPIAQFTLACVGLIPLAGIIGDATEELRDLTNEVIGGLLSASFGNAPELIFAIMCVVKGLDDLVKGSLIGSILGNLLLVLGSAYIIGGFEHGIQQMKYEIVHTAGFYLLVFGSFMFLFPTIANQMNENNVISISVTTSVVFIIIYCAYTYFQLTNIENMASDSTSSLSKSSLQNRRSGRSYDGVSKRHRNLPLMNYIVS